MPNLPTKDLKALLAELYPKRNDVDTVIRSLERYARLTRPKHSNDVVPSRPIRRMSR